MQMQSGQLTSGWRPLDTKRGLPLPLQHCARRLGNQTFDPAGGAKREAVTTKAKSSDEKWSSTACLDQMIFFQFSQCALEQHHISLALFLYCELIRRTNSFNHNPANHLTGYDH